MLFSAGVTGYLSHQQQQSQQPTLLPPNAVSGIDLYPSTNSTSNTTNNQSSTSSSVDKFKISALSSSTPSTNTSIVPISRSSSSSSLHHNLSVTNVHHGDHVHFQSCNKNNPSPNLISQHQSSSGQNTNQNNHHSANDQHCSSSSFIHCNSNESSTSPATNHSSGSTTSTMSTSKRNNNNNSDHSMTIGNGSNSSGSNEVRNVMLYGIPIVSLLMDGQERLCLAQISNTLLKNFSYNEIHNRRVALGITCVQCTPVQLELLRRAGAMPVSSRRCGMITKREAERLCKSFLAETEPPKLPESFSFDVYHSCAWGCRGSFTPSRYNSSRAKCIKCSYCGLFFSPNKFIFHSHRLPSSKYVQPDAANFNSWRRHIKLVGSPEPADHVIYAWEDVKAMFNGGSRKRAMTSTLNSFTKNQEHHHSGSNNNNPNSSSNRLIKNSSRKQSSNNSGNKTTTTTTTGSSGPTTYSDNDNNSLCMDDVDDSDDIESYSTSTTTTTTTMTSAGQPDTASKAIAVMNSFHHYNPYGQHANRFDPLLTFGGQSQNHSSINHHHPHSDLLPSSSNLIRPESSDPLIVVDQPDNSPTETNTSASKKFQLLEGNSFRKAFEAVNLISNYHQPQTNNFTTNRISENKPTNLNNNSRASPSLSLSSPSLSHSSGASPTQPLQSTTVHHHASSLTHFPHSSPTKLSIEISSSVPGFDSGSSEHFKTNTDMFNTTLVQKNNSQNVDFDDHSSELIKDSKNTEMTNYQQSLPSYLASSQTATTNPNDPLVNYALFSGSAAGSKFLGTNPHSLGLSSLIGTNSAGTSTTIPHPAILSSLLAAGSQIQTNTGENSRRPSVSAYGMVPGLDNNHFANQSQSLSATLPSSTSSLSSTGSNATFPVSDFHQHINLAEIMWSMASMKAAAAANPQNVPGTTTSSATQNLTPYGNFFWPTPPALSQAMVTASAGSSQNSSPPNNNSNNETNIMDYNGANQADELRKAILFHHHQQQQQINRATHFTPFLTPNFPFGGNFRFLPCQQAASHQAYLLSRAAAVAVAASASENLGNSTADAADLPTETKPTLGRSSNSIKSISTAIKSKSPPLLRVEPEATTMFPHPDPIATATIASNNGSNNWERFNAMEMMMTTTARNHQLLFETYHNLSTTGTTGTTEGNLQLAHGNGNKNTSIFNSFESGVDVPGTTTGNAAFQNDNNEESNYPLNATRRLLNNRQSPTNNVAKKRLASSNNSNSSINNKNSSNVKIKKLNPTSSPNNNGKIKQMKKFELFLNDKQQEQLIDLSTVKLNSDTTPMITEPVKQCSNDSVKIVLKDVISAKQEQQRRCLPQDDNNIAKSDNNEDLENQINEESDQNVYDLRIHNSSKDTTETIASNNGGKQIEDTDLNSGTNIADKKQQTIKTTTTETSIINGNIDK